jgi:hypothetical protein
VKMRPSCRWRGFRQPDADAAAGRIRCALERSTHRSLVLVSKPTKRETERRLRREEPTWATERQSIGATCGPSSSW